ncbi:MAG TPA: hypothetical protein VHE55_19465 [Fimbriimonadaceae bacterium]|nr:hypothetical protein [Fimbriimonadaceae bacterium]
MKPCTTAFWEPSLRGSISNLETFSSGQIPSAGKRKTMVCVVELSEDDSWLARQWLALRATFHIG